MADINYKIIKHLGVISTRNGWNKEVNLIEWNGRPAKVDIREWSDDKTKMSKGITLSIAEIREFKAILDNIDLSVE